jgi:outer membrane lipoprotein LolB
LIFAMRIVRNPRRAVLLLALSACAVLSACRTVPPVTVPVVDLGLAADWPQRRALLQALRYYQCTGRVAVSAAGQGFNAQFAWRQMGDDTELTLRGPLGVGGLIVRSSAAQLALQTTDGRKLDGEAARAELERATGASLPITTLGYWLLGVPAPDLEATETLVAAEQGQPAQLGALLQQGWQIEYQPHGGSPRQMLLTSGDTRVRLLIDRWNWR